MSIGYLTLALAMSQFFAPPVDRIDASAVRAEVDVERAAREYRRNVYLNFRTNREEFDRRWKAGEDLYQHWTAIRKPASHGQAVEAWFAQAAAASSWEGGVLPPHPYLPEPSLPTAFSVIEPTPADIDDPAPQPDPLADTTPPGFKEAADEGDLEKDNPFLPPLGIDAPSDSIESGDLPGSIRSLLDFGESVFSTKDQAPAKVIAPIQDR